MKTIATAAVLMMLSAPAWADDADQQTNDPANTDEPIVLSEAEMDGVTAGASRKNLTILMYDLSETDSSSGSSSIRCGWCGIGADAFM